MPPEFNTLEDARAEILRLNEELTKVTNDRDNYITKTNDLTKEVENVRALNQQYFLKLSAQYNKPTENDEPEDDTPSCEEFAQTLTI